MSSFHPTTVVEREPALRDGAPAVRGRRAFLAWASWWATVLLIAGVFALRMVYLVWWSPYELAGDEAYYWDCSRHLSLCYYEKGPGLPWVIAACCRVLGDHEWVIRLPAAACAAAGALVAARLAMRLAGGDARAGFVAAAFFALIPAFQANAQISTQDAPTLLIWILLTAAGLRVMRRWEEGADTLGDWMGCAALLGLGFLFKQSILLFLSGAGIYVFVRRRALRPSGRLVARWVLAGAVFGLVVSPMIVWNQRHGWPTVAHTLGHLGTPGGDHDLDKPDHFSLLSPLSLIGAQLGAVGIPALWAMGVACAAAWRGRRDAADDRWRARLWLICASIPAVAFFVGLSFVKPVIGSWPWPSFVPLVVLVAVIAVERGGRARFDAKLARAVVMYGIGGWAVVSFPTFLASLPGVGARFEKSVMRRVTGHRAHAAELERLIDANRDPAGRPPVVIARYYMDAALDAFYLPGRPAVINAGTLTGQRPTSYDYWADNDLNDPALLGRSAVMDGGSPTRPWERVLSFDALWRVPDAHYTIAVGYRGVMRR